MSLESMEREMVVLKKAVLTKHPEEKPPPGYMYPSITEPTKGSKT
jgi:hypothetical protein